MPELRPPQAGCHADFDPQLDDQRMRAAEIATVEGRQVQVGDRVHNRYGYCPSAEWEEVVKVEERAPDQVWIYTRYSLTIKHPREAVAVKRMVQQRGLPREAASPGRIDQNHDNDTITGVSPGTPLVQQPTTSPPVPEPHTASRRRRLM